MDLKRYANMMGPYTSVWQSLSGRVVQHKTYGFGSIVDVVNLSVDRDGEL